MSSRTYALLRTQPREVLITQPLQADKGSMIHAGRVRVLNRKSDVSPATFFVLPERFPVFEISIGHALHLLEMCKMGQDLLPIESLC